MVDFKPIEGVPYAQGRHDYVRIFHDLHKASRDRAIATYRALCREDLFFLLYFCCGKHFINTDYRTAKWWVDRINEVETGPASGTLDIWSRATGKSTVITFGDTMQRILRDANQRIAIFSYNRAEAKKFLREHKLAFESNMFLQMWFPEIVWTNPKRQSPKWSEDEGLFLRRSSTAREGTLEAWGLTDSQPTGRHFTHMVYDDVVTQEAVRTPGAFELVANRFSMSKNLGADRFTERVLGTRYDFSDLYGDLIEKAEAGDINLHIRVRPVVEDWPDCTKVHLWTADEIRAKESDMRQKGQGSFVFASQVLCNPVDPENAPFKPEHLRYWTALPEGSNHWPKYLLVDPAGWDERGQASGGDSAAFVVVGVDPEGKWYVLDLHRGRYNPKKCVDLIFSLDEKWDLRLVGIEKEKYGKTMKWFLEQEMTKRGWPLKIEEIPVGGRSKHDKIMGLQALYESGMLIVHPDQRQLIEEFRRFPGWSADDCVDALSSGLHIIPKHKPRTAPRREALPTARNRFGSW